MDIEHGQDISQKEWYILKDAILGVSYHKGSDECKWYTSLPNRLKEHEIGLLIYEALYKNNKSALDKAVKMMTGNSDNGWVALEKI